MSHESSLQDTPLSCLVLCFAFPILSILHSSPSLLIHLQGLPWPQSQMHLQEIRAGLQLLVRVATARASIAMIQPTVGWDR